MMRTHRGGELRASDIGTEVALCGWTAHRRDHGGVIFLDLRDAAGVVQVVVDPSTPAGAVGERVRAEWVLRIVGEVRARPDGTVNPDMVTGEIEVVATSIEVLNESEPPPFPLDDRADVDEVLRLRYRYLDLRRDRMQHNLRVRARMNAAIRNAMDAQGFVEVETPMLIASTPEGARDFVVPSRLSPGEFYALPQSPQLLKQLLMVGGFDRYYQIARCLRDEDLRADRQFEFMQLDAEMSFATPEDVFACITAAVVAATQAATGETPGEFARITWRDAMERLGQARHPVRHGTHRRHRRLRGDGVQGIPRAGDQGDPRRRIG
jgi:aspartyl-tRNA synthetase